MSPKTSEASERAAEPAPTALPASSKYWQAMSGFTYQKMIADREAQGQKGYRQQELFLTELIQGEQRRLGRPLDLLEFGCGFGRHSWYLSALENVRYHGYDFSEEMVAPLRQLAPAPLTPLSEHLFVGPDVLKAVGDRRFDVVFTVSVLIHNPPDRLPGIFATLASLLKPGGMICLVENQLVPFGVYENDWHQGCWLHRYLDAIPEGWDLFVNHGSIATHDIYVARRGSSSARRLFRLASAGGIDAAVSTSEPELDSLGLPKLKAWADQAAGALSKSAPEEAHTTEISELWRAQREQISQRTRLLSMVADLAAVRADLSAEPPFPRRSQGPDSVPPGPHSRTPPVVFDELLDREWANQDPRFARVVHLFHQEWHGIRAASGYLPGHKLAITAEHPLQARDLRQALDACVGSLAQVLVLHGYSENADRLLRLARRTLGPSLRIHAVWHGSTSQFHYDFERASFARLLGLRRRGILNGFACVKPEMHRLSPEIFPKAMLNIPPSHMKTPGPREGADRSALIAVPNNWWKNFYTNYYAVVDSKRIDRLWVTTNFVDELVGSPSFKLVRVPPATRRELFRLLIETDVVLNVTLSECQPMTAVEGVALGVPCLTGSLGLGELDRHPYQQLVQVPGADSVGAIHGALDRVLDLVEQDPKGLAAMIADYGAVLKQRGLDAYGEFLSL